MIGASLGLLSVGAKASKKKCLDELFDETRISKRDLSHSILSQDEILELLKIAQRQMDSESGEINETLRRDRQRAIDRISESHQRFVFSIVQKLKRVARPSSYPSTRDLFQSGNLGLLEAIRKFDVEKMGDVPFANYARYYIKASIYRTLFGGAAGWGGASNFAPKCFLIRKERQRLEALMERPVSFEEAVTSLFKDKVITAHKNSLGRLARQCEIFLTSVKSLNEPIWRVDGTEGDIRWEQALWENRETEDRDLRESLDHINLARRRVLTPRESEILRFRFDENLKPSVIGSQIGLTADRIRQIQKAALEKIAQFFENAGDR